MGSYASEPKIDVCSITTNLLVPTFPNQTIQVPIGNCISFRLPSSIRNFMFNDCLQGNERTGRILTQFKIASGSWSPLYPANFDCNSSDVTPIINITEETQFRFVILSNSFVSGVYNWVNGEYLGPYIDPGWQFYNIPSITVIPTLIPSNAIRTPGSNQTKQECVVPNQDLKVYPPTDYPLVTTQEELTCRKFGGLYPQTHYTNYTLEKSNNASTFQFVDRQSNYGFIPTQYITNDLTSFRYKFSAPTGCIPGADQNQAYYHTYTSGELRLFTSAYTYNQTIGDLYELIGTQRSKTTPTMSGCSTPTKLYVDPPLKYGIANSDLTYKWILPSNWQLHSSNNTNEGKGLNEINVIPINFNPNTSPPFENVTLEISWTSPCGRVDKITRTFTVNYDFNLQQFGSLFSGYNSSDNLDDPYLFNGLSFGASLSTSFISCNANLFIQTPMYYSETELKEGFMNRDYILEDNLGPLVAGTDYFIEPATSMDPAYRSRNRFITPTELRDKKLIVRINLTDFYFNSRNIIQTEIRHKINFTGACQSFTRSNLNILKSYHFKSSATPPAPTINSNIDLCLDNNIVFNIGLLNKPKNTTWKFFNGSTQLVENIDYTVVNISNTNANATIKFNPRIFGTTNPLNAVTLKAQYVANFIGNCGTKTSESLNFTIYNNNTAGLLADAISNSAIANNVDFICSRGNNNAINTSTFSIANLGYKNLTWEFKQIINDLDGPTINISNTSAFLDATSNTWKITTALREPDITGKDFQVNVEAYNNVCGLKNPIANRTFTIKNAKYNLPAISISRNDIKCTGVIDVVAQKPAIFEVPIIDLIQAQIYKYSNVSWKFFDANGSEYPSNNYTLTNESINGEKVSFMFYNFSTTKVDLTVRATLMGECNSNVVTSSFSLYNIDPATALPAPTVRTTGNLCGDKAIVLNHNATKTPTTIIWKIFNGNTQLVKGLDYTETTNNTSGTFVFDNTRIFGTSTLKSTNLTASYDATFVGDCGLKTSVTSAPFVLFNGSIRLLTASDILKVGNCTRGIEDVKNIISISMPDFNYTSISTPMYFKDLNGNRLGWMNFNRNPSYLDPLTNRWIVTGDLQQSYRPVPVVNTTIEYIQTNNFDVDLRVNYATACKSESLIVPYNQITRAESLNLDFNPFNSKICTEGSNTNRTIFNVTATAGIDVNSWKFFDANNVEYTALSSSFTNNNKTCTVLFDNLLTPSVNLYAAVTYTTPCGQYTKKSNVFTLNNNELIKPTVVLSNPKQNNTYCPTDIVTLQATSGNPNTNVLEYKWEITGERINGSTQIINRSSGSNSSISLDLGFTPFSNFTSLYIKVKTRHECSDSPESRPDIWIFRRPSTTATPTTGTISYLDPNLSDRIKNTGLCNGNHAYFYTNATSTNNTWLWKIDNALVATTVEPKLKLPVNFATNNNKIVTLQTIDANGCPTLPISAEAITMNSADAPILAYDKTLVNVPVSYTKYDVPGGRNVNGHASVMYVKNTNTAVTGTMDWKWYEQNNIIGSSLSCYVTNTMAVVPVAIPAAQPSSFSKTTKPDADNTIKQLQFSFWAGGSYVPNLSCKYIVMAKKDGLIPNSNPIIPGTPYTCWSDPYIVMTEGASGTGPLRKEVTSENEISLDATEIVLNAEVFPNPTEGKITIKIPTENGLLIMTDAQGKKVGSYDLMQTSTELDMVQYPAGLYNLSIITKLKTYQIKLMIGK
ncbi:MAG: T9SS C-terminal target domain-containing protein [Cytophagales bacterium]|nr:MAG: T9SS C-terminal target domain-containing protein [Cytophagales bacterium]